MNIMWMQERFDLNSGNSDAVNALLVRLPYGKSHMSTIACLRCPVLLCVTLEAAFCCCRTRSVHCRGNPGIERNHPSSPMAS